MLIHKRQLFQLEWDYIEALAMLSEEQAKLDTRDVDILKGLAEGLSLKDIAYNRRESYQGTRNKLKRLLDRLGADTAYQAIAMAQRRGLLE